MSSHGPSEPLELELALPTTAEDIAALRRLRQPAGRSLLERLGDLQPPDLFGPVPRRRSTAAGFEPFSL